MDKFFENFIIDDVEAYHEDGFCAIFCVFSVFALILCIVLLVVPSFTTPDRITDGLYEAKTKAVLEYLDRGSKPIIGKPGVQSNNGKETSFSMVPMVFPLPEAPERCVTPKEELKMTPISQKADVKHMPATLKAVPGKPLSEAPVNSNFEVKKGPTYTWSSSGNTVKIIYPDGKVEIVSKSLLPYLLGK